MNFLELTALGIVGGGMIAFIMWTYYETRNKIWKKSKKKNPFR